MSDKRIFMLIPLERMGRLVVIGRSSIKKRGAAFWDCLCDCGNVTTVTITQFRAGKKLSCGCLKKEKLKREKTTHGKSSSKTYYSWHNMMRRCYEKSHRVFNHYGGRGISVCERWHSFEMFLADMGEKQEGMTLERNDVDGDYSPENCIWASQKVQTRNRRKTIMVNIFGKRKSLADACDDMGLKYKKIRDRIKRFGWSDEKALLTP